MSDNVPPVCHRVPPKSPQWFAFTTTTTMGFRRAPEAKRLRKAAARAASAVAAPLPLRFADLGGMEPVLQLVRELVQYPLKHPEVYRWLGVDPPRGVLLHGPPGCGKTALANAIANECDVPFLKISAPEVCVCVVLTR